MAKRERNLLIDGGAFLPQAYFEEYLLTQPHFYHDASSNFLQSQAHRSLSNPTQRTRYHTVCRRIRTKYYWDDVMQCDGS